MQIKVIFLGKPVGASGWPYPELETSKRARFLLKPIRETFSDIEFREFVVESTETAISVGKKLKEEKIDGVIIWPLVGSSLEYSEEELINSGNPTIVVSDLYGGDKILLKIWDLAKRTDVPILPISSSNVEDLIRAINIIRSIYLLRQKRILVIEGSKEANDQAHFWRRSYEEYLYLKKK